MRPPRRILLIKMSALGDVVQTLAVAHELKRVFPQVQISWLISSTLSPLLEGNPEIDEIFLFHRRRWGGLTAFLRHYREFLRLIADLRRRRFDWVLDLQGLFRSGLITLLSNCRRRVGFANARELATLAYTHKIPVPTLDIHAVERYLQMAALITGQPALPAFPLILPDAARAFARQQISRHPTLAVSPGARWQTKQWPPTHFAAVIDRLLEQQNCEVVLIGAPDEMSIGQSILAHCRQLPLNLIGKTTLPQMVAILERADVVLSNDSGPMHVAAALGTPVVALFGPTFPARTAPYGPGHLVLQKTLPCGPCMRRTCAFDVQCLNSLAVEEVLEAVVRLLHPSMNPRMEITRGAGLCACH